MSKTVEELLKPRFQVKAYWPDCPFTVGDILVPDFEEPDQYVVEGLGLRSPILNDSPTRWPHLFKKMEWWLHRDQKEMPEYIKWPDTGIVAKVTRYQVDDSASWGVFYLDDDFSYHLMHAMPATAEEYNNYKAKKDGTVNG